MLTVVSILSQLFFMCIQAYTFIYGLICGGLLLFFKIELFSTYFSVSHYSYLIQYGNSSKLTGIRIMHFSNAYILFLEVAKPPFLNRFLLMGYQIVFCFVQYSNRPLSSGDMFQDPHECLKP